MLYPQGVKAARDESEAAARRIAQQSSEIADDRPVGSCAFSPDGSLLAACGWGGALNLWRATDSANVAREGGWRAHAERSTGLAWHPRATLGHVSRAAHTVPLPAVAACCCSMQLALHVPAALSSESDK